MKYKYNGPPSGVTLNIGSKEESKIKEIIFFQGNDYDLPNDNEYVKTLIARGHLAEIQAEKTTKKEAKIAG